MYNEPKNTYEMAMNKVYQDAEQYINNRTYAGLEPITANLVRDNLPETYI